MWWFASKEEIRKAVNKIKKQMSKLTGQTSSNRILIENHEDKIKEFISKREIDLMIREAVLKVRETPPRTPRTPQTAIRKKADKMLNKAEIMHEIGSLLQKGLSTGEAHHQIVEIKQLCKKTCFFKYLKLIREQGLQTPRTAVTN